MCKHLYDSLLRIMSCSRTGYFHNMAKRNDKTVKAYNFFLVRESEKIFFSLNEISKATGWKVSSIKTYINKQWSGFITPVQNISSAKQKKYQCSGLSVCSQDDFIKIHSQKLKFSPKVYTDSTGIDTLVLKARQFSLLAIHIYNTPYTEFKTYGYVVNIIIAWTALLHAIFKKKKIDFFCKNKDGTPIIIDGDRKTWPLSESLDKYWKTNSPMKSNLDCLIKLRNKIEHINLPEIDVKFSGHLQASLTNFESILTKEFGKQHALMPNISLALQLSVTQEQKKALNKIQSDLILANRFIDSFEEKLPKDFLSSPEYRATYFLTPKTSNNKTSCNLAIEIIQPGSDEELEVNKILTLIKEREKEKFKPKQIVVLMNREGYRTFTMHKHTLLWKEKNAKENSSYGVKLSDGQWYWYATWVDVVREYCRKNNL